MHLCDQSPGYRDALTLDRSQRPEAHDLEQAGEKPFLRDNGGDHDEDGNIEKDGVLFLEVAWGGEARS